MRDGFENVVGLFRGRVTAYTVVYSAKQSTFAYSCTITIQFAAVVSLPNNPMFTNIVFKLGEAK